MKKGLIPSFFILLLLHHSSFSQEYSYTHYDISDGLAGSTTYCMTQDKQGFIWIGTETGASRFDGTHFRNFTTMDGLPDAEVLDLFCDSKGRVWMAPFSKSICYYYKGKIYNADNDTVLRKIRLKGNIEHLAEDMNGDILIGEKTVLHLFRNDGRITNYDSIDDLPIIASMAVSTSISGHFLVQERKTLYELSGDKFKKLLSVNFPDNVPSFMSLTKNTVTWKTNYPHRTAILVLKTGKTIYFPCEVGHISYTSELKDQMS